MIIGLTGSIAMGKSWAARCLRRQGVPIFDADAAVHELYAHDKRLIAAIGQEFPGCVENGKVDRPALASQVLGDRNKLKRLEAMVHPRVRRMRNRFLRSAAIRGERLAVLVVPLLFETGGDAECDLSVAISAPAAIQKKRVLARPGMTPERLRSILARQLPDREKRRRADFVIQSGLGRDHHFRQVKRLIALALDRKDFAWRPGRYPLDMKAQEGHH